MSSTRDGINLSYRFVRGEKINKIVDDYISPKSLNTPIKANLCTLIDRIFIPTMSRPEGLTPKSSEEVSEKELNVILDRYLKNDARSRLELQVIRYIKSRKAEIGDTSPIPDSHEVQVVVKGVFNNWFYFWFYFFFDERHIEEEIKNFEIQKLHQI